MSSDTHHVSLDDLRRFMMEVLEALEVPPSDAAIGADVLITADRFGIESHGIQRLGYYVDRIRNGVTDPRTRISVVTETATTAVLDGNHGLGHVIAVDAMRRAIGKARDHGLGAVAVRNSNHYGIAGYYALLAVRENMIGLTTTNARPCMAPTFGTEPMFGTNPIGFGAPSDEEWPFLYDAALSITQRGRIEVASRSRTPIPEGMAIDAEGHAATDATALLDQFVTGDAALLPLGGAGETFGGHKGFGLAMAMEILNAALQGGSFLTGLGGGDRDGAWRPYNTGHFFLALDVSAFIEPEAFRRTVGDIMRTLRASRRVAGAERIWTAGEKEWEAARRRDAHGVPLAPELRRELAALQRTLGLTGHTFLVDP